MGAVTEKPAAVTLLNAAVSLGDRLKPGADTERAAALTQGRELIASLIERLDVTDLAEPGDDYVLGFSQPRDAIRCAREMQDAIREHNTPLAPTNRLILSVGIHSGPPGSGEAWRRGVGLRIATGLRILARGGGIFVSAAVHEQVRREPGIRLQEVGDWSVEEGSPPLRAYQVVAGRSGSSALRAIGEALAEIRSRVPMPAIVVATLVLAVWAYFMGPTAEVGWVGEPPDSLAVLPFDGDRVGHEAGTYRESIPGSIIDGLRAYEGLDLTSRTSSFAFQGDTSQPTLVGRTLGVDGIVVGYTNTAGTWLLARVAIVRVSDGERVWSGAYYRPTSEVEAVQQEIVTGIAEALGLKLRERGAQLASIGEGGVATASGPSHEEIAAALETDLREARDLPASDPLRVTSLNNLAALYYDSGHDGRALPLYREALALREEVYGPVHPEVAVSLNNLASVYTAMGRLAEAEILFSRSLQIRERTLGPTHPRVATALNNLASLHHRQGRLQEAEKLYRRALEIRQAQLRVELGQEAAGLSEEAARYQVRGMYAEAQDHYEEALAVERRAAGPSHPSTGSALRNLAILLGLRGQPMRAEPLLKRSISIFEKTLGSQHPQVARSLADLGEIHATEGRLVEAQRYHEQSLEIYERSLGPEHPEVARSLSFLVSIFELQGREGRAAEARQRSEAIRKSYLGPFFSYVRSRRAQHRVLRSRVNDDYALPQPLYERMVAIDTGRLHAERQRLAESLFSLALLYTDQGRYAQAENEGKRALAIYESLQGPGDPMVALSMHILARIYSLQGRFKEAEPLFIDSRQILEDVLGTDHPHLARSWREFADMLRGAGRIAEAELAEARAQAIRHLNEPQPDRV